jgi:hypothetical protein
MKLPVIPDTEPIWKPYDASCINLKSILAVTTESPILKRLLQWGAQVKEEDLMVATKCLIDSQVRIFIIFTGQVLG